MPSIRKNSTQLLSHCPRGSNDEYQISAYTTAGLHRALASHFMLIIQSSLTTATTYILYSTYTI